VGIAISLLFATALVLPGILFNYYLRKGTWKSPVVLQSFQNSQFSNEWHYYFSGEARVFGIKNPSRDVIKKFLSTEIDGVYLSFTIDKNSEAYLYWGLLYEYYFDKKGNLEKIVLTDVSRRKLTNDFTDDSDERISEDSEDIMENQFLEVADTRFYPIRGEYIVFDYSEIKDLNIEYVILEEELNN